VDLVRSDVSEECFAYIIRVKRINEVVTTLAATSNFSYLAESFHPDDASDTFIRKVGSYKIHNVVTSQNMNILRVYQSVNTNFKSLQSKVVKTPEIDL
jgi:hypothetical protein